MEQKLISTVEFEKKFTDKGYIRIFVDSWIYEHVFVVEQFIGRKLLPSEVVHHIDFCKSNNLIYNLVIFPNNKEHSHWHRQYKQFKLTRPLINKIKLLKEAMEQERSKHE